MKIIIYAMLGTPALHLLICLLADAGIIRMSIKKSWATTRKREILFVSVQKACIFLISREFLEK